MPTPINKLKESRKSDHDVAKQAAHLIWVEAEVAEIGQRRKVVAMEQELMRRIAPEQAELQRLEQIRVTAREAMTALL